ncbi:cytochrome c biogenesis protein [Singulisphaera sp. PoT]|uniref:cytochrome c biogenesis protein n=1 Tax=Singulisphaera sp. PoT TaxID=3411797 RepID=UPI003BF548AB
MKRFGWLLLGLPLAWSICVPAVGAEADKPPKFGEGSAYESVAKLPILNSGRKKPLDTLARQVVKLLFGRETITLHDDSNKAVATWGPVGAYVDWSARPEFWDDQSFILVEYVPLKQLILADVIQARLKAAMERPELTPAARDLIKSVASSKDITSQALNRLLNSAKLNKADHEAIESLANKLVESHKWLTPRELETAEISLHGDRHPFMGWIQELMQRKNAAEKSGSASPLDDIEKRAIEVAEKLVTYQAHRDRTVKKIEPLLVMPRPTNAAYLAYCASALKKAQTQGSESLSPLELDSVEVLMRYENDIPSDERAMPGEKPEFDKAFSAWLVTHSSWVPLIALISTKAEELEKAGYPPKAFADFLAAIQGFDKAEEAKPGNVDKAKADALVAAARTLGQEVNKVQYPTAKDMDREAYFNASNPFFKAPAGYGIAVALLAVSLGFVSTRKGSAVALLGTAVYFLGLAGLLVGIALEIVGFTLRVQISGWAPVTNMYETVIWVSLVAAVLGLVFELIYRKTFAALAGAGAALLGTVLAANVPLLDPGIHALQPVLRSNYWLTIHVLTEVSSYAAFALAMMLGLIATFYYLTATYRRSPSYMEVVSPALPGLPMLGVGIFGLAASFGGMGINLPADRASLLYYVSAALAGVGGSLSIIGIGAGLGELVSRLMFRDGQAYAMAGATASASAAATAPPATSVQTVTVGEEGGAVATLTKPTVAEIRARAAASRPQLDPRGQAMQATAAKIKPLSNFIYRTMQVGVLLIAAGTILGGVWADASWGRFWGWDPKEVWALITLLVYLIPLHGRFAGWVNTFGLVFSSVVCFLSVVMAWYGVNFVLGVGLHSYGFVEGGSQGVVGAVILGVLALTGAAAWRRGLASRVEPTPAA